MMSVISVMISFSDLSMTSDDIKYAAIIIGLAKELHDACYGRGWFVKQGEKALENVAFHFGGCTENPVDMQEPCQS